MSQFLKPSHLHFFSLLLSFAGAGAGSSFSIASAAELIPAKLKFATSIAAPSVLTTCEGNLWVYGIGDRALYQLNLETGEVIRQSSFSKSGSLVTALGCGAKALLIASQERGAPGSPRSYSLEQVPLAGNPVKLGARKRLNIPGTGLIRDISCGATGCILIRDGVHQSSNLKTWKKLNLPASKDIVGTEPGMPGLTENPFAGWHDRFIIANGRYFRAVQEETGGLWLLDPNRSSIVSFEEPLPGKSTRWGRWGVWEGRLMSPKGFALIGKDYVAVSDTALKLVFIFARNGKFIGSLGADAKGARFGYPLSLAASANRLYVADLALNKLLGFEIDPGQKPEPQDTKSFDEILRKNLFRDPEVLKDRVRTRCMNCHDGVEINSLDKSMYQGKHHPVNIESRATKIDLPLENGKTVICATCHDAHHGNRATDSGRKNLFMLRKPVDKLCITCHAGRDVPSTNHINPDPAESCSSCHAMHVAEDYLLKQALPALCLDCHGRDKVPSSHPFSAGMVTCTSCHSLHDSLPKHSFATHSLEKPGQKTTCLACHEDKKPLIGKNVHLGAESQSPHKWPPNEAMCLDCHNPHKKAVPVRDLCAGCHGQMAGSHTATIPLENTPQGKGIQLEKGKVSCMTCHEPHGSPPPTAQGRQFFREKAKLMEFCATCHGEDAPELYQTFHKRPK